MRVALLRCTTPALIPSCNSMHTLGASLRNPRFTRSDPALTFPDKDLAVGSVVQDKAVVPYKQVLGQRTLFRDLGQLHRSCRV